MSNVRNEHELSTRAIPCSRIPLAQVQLASGDIVGAEVHWYEATGIGKREFKIKRLL